MVVKKVLNDNKFISGIIVFVLGALLLWGTWVTTGAFARQSAIDVNTKSIQMLSTTLNEVRTDVKSLSALANNQDEILRLIKEMKRDSDRGRR